MTKKKTPHADHGSPEIQQHGEYQEIETPIAGVTALRNTTHDPVETYRKRKLITERQYRAADRLAAQYRRATLTAVYATVRWDDIRSGGLSDRAAEIVTHARDEVRAALAHVGFPLAGVLEHVAGNGGAVNDWSGVSGSSRPAQDGMVALRLALDGLCQFYKM